CEAAFHNARSCFPKRVASLCSSPTLHSLQDCTGQSITESKRFSVLQKSNFFRMAITTRLAWPSARSTVRRFGVSDVVSFDFQHLFPNSHFSISFIFQQIGSQTGAFCY